MNTFFYVKLIRGSNSGEADVALELPAMPYTLQDAVDRASPPKAGTPRVRIDAYYDCGFLASVLTDEPELYALNALARKLNDLDEWQFKQFEGLVMLDKQNGSTEIGLDRLYDLASSTSAVTLLPATVGKIENGVLLENGQTYAVRTDEIENASRSLDLTPKEPDYAVLLDAQTIAMDRRMTLKLPADNDELDMRAILCWRCTDCRIPSLKDAISGSEDPDGVGKLAELLQKMSGEELSQYKALLEQHGFIGLSEALSMAESMESYAPVSTPDEPIEPREGDMTLGVRSVMEMEM